MTTPTAQYAKDAAMDNSRILFDRHTGNPCGWTDMAGKAHPLPVDFKRVSAATAEQFRSYWLERQFEWCTEVPADERTMDHVDVRGFVRPGYEATMTDGGTIEIKLSCEQSSDFFRNLNAKEDRRDFWQHIAIIAASMVVGGAGYAALLAVWDWVMG